MTTHTPNASTTENTLTPLSSNTNAPMEIYSPRWSKAQVMSRLGECKLPGVQAIIDVINGTEPSIADVIALAWHSNNVTAVYCPPSLIGGKAFFTRGQAELDVQPTLISIHLTVFTPYDTEVRAVHARYAWEFSGDMVSELRKHNAAAADHAAACIRERDHIRSLPTRHGLLTELAAQYGVIPGAIKRIRDGEIWK